MEGYDVDSSKFPSMKIPRFVSSRTPSATRRWQENNGAVYNLEVAYLTCTYTQKQITLLLMSQRGCQSLRSCCLQRIKHNGGNSGGDCNRKEIKAVKVNGVNYGGNMDRGPTTFTSDVSLSQKTINNYAG